MAIVMAGCLSGLTPSASSAITEGKQQEHDLRDAHEQHAHRRLIRLPLQLLLTQIARPADDERTDSEDADRHKGLQAILHCVLRTVSISIAIIAPRSSSGRIIP